MSGNKAAAGAVLSRYASLLPSGSGLRVVLLASGTAPAVVRETLRHYAGHRLHVVSAGEDSDWELDRHHAAHHQATDVWGTNQALAKLGPVDVVVDLEPGPSQRHEDRWSRLFFHLRHGGAWVIPRSAVTRSPEEGFASLARVAQIVAGDAQAQRNVHERHLATATSAVVQGTDATLVLKRGEHFWKIQEQHATRTLPHREPDLEVKVLHRLPAATFDSGIEVVSHGGDDTVGDLETRFAVPEMQLRSYTGRIAVSSNGLAYAGSSVLPESFRHPFEKNLRNTRLLPANAAFGRIEREYRPTRTLEGSYFHLDSSNSGHFGHVMTEVLSRMWAWREAKSAVPDLKAIFRIRHDEERDPVLEKRLLGALGIEESDVAWVSEPVWVERLLGATPMMQSKAPLHIHPEIVERVWRPLTAGLTRDTAPEQTPGERLFVSRRIVDATRSCRNIAEVEREFARHGFTVLYPEDYDLAAQAAIFRDARVVAGFGGSALFNVMHCADLQHLVVLNSTSYTARNEQIMAAAQRSRITYFWNRPDVAPVLGTWSNDAYTSGWQFDLAQHRDGLDELFGTLA